MIILKVKKDSNTIVKGIVGIMGAVKAQANNSTKLILNIAWLNTDSAPVHLNTPIDIKTKLTTKIGAMK